MRISRYFLAAVLGVVAFVSLAHPAGAQLEAGAQPEAEPLTPLGIGWEGLDYPAQVKYLDFVNQGQPVRMAYMDVASGFMGHMAPYLPRAFEPPVVLLLHGKNFGGNYWGGTMARLVAAGFRVVVPDQIGFGKSTKPDLNYTLDLLSDNTLKLLDTLKIRQVFVVGHSLGGMLAVRFSREHPERVIKLILEDPIGLEDYAAAVPAQTTDEVWAKERADTDPAQIRKFYGSYFVTWRPEYDSFVETEERVALSPEWPRYTKAQALTYQMILHDPILPDLPKLDVPVLFVVGERDRTVVGRQFARPEAIAKMGNMPALAHAAAAQIRGASVVVVPNVGHIPHLEDPLAFEQILLNDLQH